MESTELLQSILTKLNNIEERLDRLESNVIKESMNGIAMLGDVFDEQFGSSPEESLQSYEAVQQAVEVLKLLRQPEVMGALKNLVENAPLFSQAVEQVNQIPNVISIVADAMDEYFAVANSNGIDIEDLSKNTSKAMKKLLTLLGDGSLNAVLDSGMIDHTTLNFVGALGRSLAISTREVREVGSLEILGGIFDSDVRRSVGFLKNLAKHLGEQIGQDQLSDLTKNNEIKYIQRGIQ